MNDNKENSKVIAEANSDTVSSSESKTQYKPAIIIGIITILLLIAYSIYFGMYRKLPPGDPSSWGDFGDFIGGLMNPVVGIFTIILLIQTLNLQQKAIKAQHTELSLQRNELALQRKETAKSAGALDAQYRAIQIQNFEQTLFKWLDNYRQSLKEIEIETEPSSQNNQVLRGISAVKAINKKTGAFHKELQDYFDKTNNATDEIKQLNQSRIETTFEKIITRMGRLHSAETHANLSTAIRLIYGLLRWINEHKAISDDPELITLYRSIVRAQLSEHELRLLFIFGLTSAGAKLARQANSSGLFDNLRAVNSSPIFIVLLLSNQNPYTLEAFGDNNPLALDIHNTRLHTVPPKNEA